MPWKGLKFMEYIVLCILWSNLHVSLWTSAFEDRMLKVQFIDNQINVIELLKKKRN